MYQIQRKKKWPDNTERNLLKLIVVEVLNKLEVRYWNTNDPDYQKNNESHKFFN